MREFSTFHALYRSFYSRALYRDVGRNWFRVSFLYMLLLLAICWIPVMFRFHSGVSAFVANELPKYIKQVPPITIGAGVATVDADMPHRIVHPDTGETLIVLDTGGTYSSLEDIDAGVLLTRTRLFMKDSPTSIRVVELSQMGELAIDRQKLYDWGEAVKDRLAIVVFPFAVAVSYLCRLIKVLIYAAIGLLIVSVMSHNMRYTQLMSLSIVASTPAIILDTVYIYADLAIPVPVWWSFCFVLTVGYLFFGIKACTETYHTIKI